MKPKHATKISKLKVAIVHDYLREYGGAERVVEALHALFPQAPLYVSFADLSVTGIHAHKFENWEIHESWLTKIPFYKKLFSPLRIFAPNYFQSFDLSEYDVVISSTNAYFSKAVTVVNKKSGKKALHISYCHTPARSLYGYSTRTDWKSNPVLRFFGTLLNHYLRIQDVKIARENVDYFIANSQETRRRIAKFYRLDSTVIYPPIAIKKLEKSALTAKKAGRTTKEPPNYFLTVGRFAASKHTDLAVRMATEYNLPLKVVGSGLGLEYLQSLAGPTVEFLGSVPDNELASLYEGATALLYPAEDEDFGMVPIEAMGYGIPVVAHRSGGPLETIQEGTNGYFFDEFTTQSLHEAIQKVKKTKWNKQQIHEYALGFSAAEFARKITEFVKKVVSAK